MERAPLRFVDDKGRGGTLHQLKNGRTALRYDDGRIVEVELTAHDKKGPTHAPA